MIVVPVTMKHGAGLWLESEILSKIKKLQETITRKLVISRAINNGLMWYENLKRAITVQNYLHTLSLQFTCKMSTNEQICLQNVKK